MHEFKREYLLQTYSWDEPEDKNIQHLKTTSEGVVTVTDTLMRGQTSGGCFTEKRIYVNDEINVTHEYFNIRNRGEIAMCEDSGLTRYRCGMMTAAAADMLLPYAPERIGFIGTGRTNLANCITLCKQYEGCKIVLRGSKRNLSKNAGDFMLVNGNCIIDETEDMRYINKCDLVVVCTSSVDEAETVSTSVISDPPLIIALDSGYYLDESFRAERHSFCDWKEYFDRHYDEEFPFDTQKRSFTPLSETDIRKYGKAVVYMIGMGLADAVAGKRFLEAVRK